jgi:hypothetical protein
MSSDPSDTIENGRIDLVPMIDCIMLLLLFFMMTTKFTTEEKAIASILPTNKGQMASKPQEKVDPPLMINIAIVPATTQGSMPLFELEREYQDWYTSIVTEQQPVIPAADLRVGGADPIRLANREFSVKSDDKNLAGRVQGVHAYIMERLTEYEVPGKARKDQPEIVIHCFSGLSWRYAIMAYDAARAYEAANGGVLDQNNPDDFSNARGVSFAPPRIRNYSAKALGAELYELHRLK